MIECTKCYISSKAASWKTLKYPISLCSRFKPSLTFNYIEVGKKLAFAAEERIFWFFSSKAILGTWACFLSDSGTSICGTKPGQAHINNNEKKYQQ